MSPLVASSYFLNTRNIGVIGRSFGEKMRGDNFSVVYSLSKVIEWLERETETEIERDRGREAKCLHQRQAEVSEKEIEDTGDGKDELVKSGVHPMTETQLETFLYPQSLNK